MGPNARSASPTKVGESLCLHHREASFQQLERGKEFEVTFGMSNGVAEYPKTTSSMNLQEFPKIDKLHQLLLEYTV